MKRLVTIFMFLCLVRVCFAEGAARPIEVGDVFPQFSAVDIYGKEINIEELKGKVIILSIGHFDQSRKQSEDNSAEAKKRDVFYRAHEDKGLEVIRISSKRGAPFFVTKSFVESRARKACKKDNDPWPVIIDWDGSLKGLLKMTDSPLTFIIDKDGIIRYKKNGYLIADKEVEELVKKLI